jgi:hypothetical protein
METIRTYLSLGVMGIGIFGAFFFGFKSKQAAGANRLNEWESEFGGGSFSTAFKSKLMATFWGLMVVVSLLGGLIGMGAIAPASAKKETQPVSKSAPEVPITPEVTKQEPVKVEQPKLPDPSSSEKQYDGDDPIIRARLGLPPKEKSE